MPPPSLSRRTLLITGAAALTATAVGGYFAWARPQYDGGEMTPQQALTAAQTGAITLIDIRRPDEWARTGIAANAHPIDMRDRDFAQTLSALVNGDTNRPVALICARGVRSARLSARLTAAGFTNVINVPEGMEGSRAGPGWVARGLPVRRP